MKPNLGITGKDGRPLRKCLLNAALTEIGLAGLDQGFDFIGRPGLADRNQANILWIAFRESRGLLNLFENSCTTLGGTAHGWAL